MKLLVEWERLGKWTPVLVKPHAIAKYGARRNAPALDCAFMKGEMHESGKGREGG